MLQNAKVTTFTVSELLRENQQGEFNFPQSRLGLNGAYSISDIKLP